MASSLPEESGDKCELAAAQIRRQSDLRPEIGIILGSGLGGIAANITQATSIPFQDIPGFGRSTAGGHRGELILGELFGCRVVAMAGRLHRYEGWTNAEVAFPVGVMRALGTDGLIVSNAAGGVNPKLKVGDILVIRDHINLLGGIRPPNSTANPAYGLLRGGEIYDPIWSELAMSTAVAKRFNAYSGTYLATLGPNYETRSEYRMMRRIGADVAGMSTVPEVLAAAELNMRVLGLSMVSNVANPDRPQVADHAEVLEAGKLAEVKMEAIVDAVLRSIRQ